jgi:hypothetical protein
LPVVAFYKIRYATKPKIPVMVKVLTWRVEAAPVSDELPIVVPFMSIPPEPATEDGSTLSVAAAAASLKASRVLLPEDLEDC